MSLKFGRKPYHQTKLGKIIHGDSLPYMQGMESNSVDLIVTSPPYALTEGNDKGFPNPSPEEYVDWFVPYAKEMYRVLKNTGSLVLNVGNAWNKGVPTRSLCNYRLLISLCDDIGFHLAQDLYWYKSNLGNAEWVNIRRIRLKSRVENVFWLSKTECPKANNKNVLSPYSKAMMAELARKVDRVDAPGKMRPGKQQVNSGRIYKDKGGAISSDLIAVHNTSSNDYYQRKCKEEGVDRHGARFPPLFAEFFVRFMTDKGDFVLDPFAGSCTTGEAAEATEREWICVEKDEKWLPGSLFRFPPTYHGNTKKEGVFYEVPKVGYNYSYGPNLDRFLD